MTHTKSILPSYDFSLTLNESYRKKIFPFFAEHRIAANPINYALLYDYVAEQNPELNKAIDSLLAESKTLESKKSEELYASFICNASLESFEDINQKIHRVLTRASNAIDETFNKAEQTGESFEQKSALLENTSEVANHQAIFQDIIRETRALAVTTQAMQSELTKANTEMEQLRAELVTVRKVATTDGLTGLLNRHAFDEIMSDIVRGNEKPPVCLAMLDIDHFKQVNDTWGHTIGDNVIRYVAALIKKHVSEYHHVARYGGEEMIIVMPGTSKNAALAIAENIRSDMEKSRLKRKSDDHLLGKITISIGIAELQQNDTAENFVNRADEALYKAKDSGRNKVVG
ncbi:GGDEF domain-containing protein [Kineobactrum sediminis]|uniref:diguanylate cyclase n=1 Tax=Kineobactrum sediminis TaxID=1905677 RepID=A0A2N5Y0U8_9GAMM|nr:GGDEF domain-containing protein [Kineobactrum sediminis]PLW82022.1 GGDEF domain-containing protein [Kineobactrum sediminis]